MSVSARYWDSPTNQDIKRKFVREEVYANISDMAEYLFDYEGEKYASYDEFDNYNVMRCPYCDHIIDDYDALTEYNPEDEEGLVEYHPCPHCGREIAEEPDYDEPEIYEYWIVTPYLGYKLRDLGECVLERYYGGWIWGRQCTGQAILLDGVISKICNDIGLLKETEE